MRVNACEHIQLIAGMRGHRYVNHLAMRLEYSKNTFMLSTAVLKCNNFERAAALISHDNLEFVSIPALNRFFEFNETLEGKRNGEFDTSAMQSLNEK